MSSATHTGNGRTAAAQRLDASAPAWKGVYARAKASFAFGVVFGDAVLRYLLVVFPHVSQELAHWQARAREIPDRRLRGAAEKGLSKRGNIEGAALFATLAPARRRRATVRALVTFQTAYNYLDALSELPNENPSANADQLHQALLGALHPGGQHGDYYAHNPDREDGGYLLSILDSCREAVQVLPSFHALAPAAREGAARIVDFQALNLTEEQGGHDALKAWASHIDDVEELCWWEAAAASGSSLAVHAMIAAAACPGIDAHDAGAIARAYFPWIGALHSLLDSLVDRQEDHESHQRSLLDYYRSPAEESLRLGLLASASRLAVQGLPQSHRHRVILTAMCSYYLSARECYTVEGLRITHGLTGVLSSPLRLAIVMFRAKRVAHGLTRRAYV